MLPPSCGQGCAKNRPPDTSLRKSRPRHMSHASSAAQRGLSEHVAYAGAGACARGLSMWHMPGPAQVGTCEQQPDSAIVVAFCAVWRRVAQLGYNGRSDCLDLGDALDRTRRQDNQVLWRQRALRGRHAAAQRGRAVGARRAQRRRQDHAAAHHHGRGVGRRGYGVVREGHHAWVFGAGSHPAGGQDRPPGGGRFRHRDSRARALHLAHGGPDCRVRAGRGARAPAGALWSGAGPLRAPGRLRARL